MLVSTVLVAIGLLFQVCLASKVKGVTKLNFNIKTSDADANSPVVKKLMRRANDVSPVILQNWFTYFSINATIGTPAQEFELFLAPLIADTFVLGRGNKYCSPSTRLDKRTTEGLKLQKRADSDSDSGSGSRTVSHHPSNSGYDYVPSASATLNCNLGQFDEEASESLQINTTGPLFQLDVVGYVDTLAQGEWATDNFRLGDFELNNFSFGVAEQTLYDGGVLGLGFEEAESTNRRMDDGENYTYPNFLSRLKNDNYINKKAFSLYTDSYNSTTGSIIFGGVDHAKYTGDLVTVPMINQYEDYGIDTISFYSISLTGVGTDVEGNRTTFSTTKYPASVETFTAWTYLPYEFAEEVVDSLGALYSSPYGFYTMTCPSLEESLSRFLVLDFQGAQITIPLYQLISYKLENRCVLSIRDSYDGTVVLGTSFFRSAYVVFDLEDKEISIAQAKYTEDEDIEAFESSIPSATQAPGYSSTWSELDLETSTGDMFESDEKITSKADVFGYTGGELDEELSLRSTTTLGSSDYYGLVGSITTSSTSKRSSSTSRRSGSGSTSRRSGSTSRRTSTSRRSGFTSAEEADSSIRSNISRRSGSADESGTSSEDSSESAGSSSSSGSGSNSVVFNTYMVKNIIWVYFSSFLAIVSLVALL